MVAMTALLLLLLLLLIVAVRMSHERPEVGILLDTMVRTTIGF